MISALKKLMTARNIIRIAILLLMLDIIYLLYCGVYLPHKKDSTVAVQSEGEISATSTEVPEVFDDRQSVPTTGEQKYTELNIYAGSARKEVVDSECETSGYTAISVSSAASGIVSIPKESNGVPIMYISSMFTMPYDATALYLPDCVTTIFSRDGNILDTGGAFYGNTYLTSFIPSDGLAYIGNKAFYGCTSLRDIFLPLSLTHIGDRAFYGCTKLDELYIFGETSIGEGAFTGCKNLKNVYLSENVRRVGMGAFEHTEYYDSLTEEFGICGDILLKYNGSSAHVVIPDGVRVIGDGVFAGNLSISSVTVPDSVEYIGNSAFRSCSNLTGLTVSEDSEISVGEYAFEDCPVAKTEVVSAMKVDKRDVFISEGTVNGI